VKIINKVKIMTRGLRTTLTKKQVKTIYTLKSNKKYYPKKNTVEYSTSIFRLTLYKSSKNKTIK